MDTSNRLSELHDHFLATSTRSMPVAGMIYWSAVAVASLALQPRQVAYVVLFGSGMIFPFALLIDKLTGAHRIKRANAENPLLQLFLRSIVMIALLWPLAILAAQAARDPNLVVLGGAVLMAIIWIPYGWAAADPAGLQHAIGRSVGCYVAFVVAPDPYKATAISVVVVLSYLYSMARMRRPAA